MKTTIKMKITTKIEILKTMKIKIIEIMENMITMAMKVTMKITTLERKYLA
ncbi:hypothetical protein [Methanotorris formicicus]|uniref:Uncharacterized protein n=1 Tax=Methanotorris formicicus Mc-S-70 TaxID=647171 RepID=H1L067_9EURY|nr:hypothetical protein [Methanotorris formicicus]EHP85201.1 hypothetical protein MetfoDRAFT_1441 [Methanotorris formicicus Mc-S-70]